METVPDTIVETLSPADSEDAVFFRIGFLIQFDEDYMNSERLVGFVFGLMFMGSKTCESDANRLRT